MIYELKNCRTGEPAAHVSTVDITKDGNTVTFFFHSEDTQYYCPNHYYNGIHSAGDAVEILIGTDPARKYYYEIEMSSKGLLMLARMTNHGLSADGDPILDVGFVDDCFIKGEYVKLENGYDCRLSFNLSDINTGDGEVYFNAFRLETEGGEINKYLYALSPTYVPKFHITDKFLWLKDCV